MDRNQVIELLQKKQVELNQLGIRSLSLFGSYARDEAQRDSDIDMLVDLEPPYTFERYIRAKFYLEDLLGKSVDLVMPDTLKPRAKVLALREAIRVT